MAVQYSVTVNNARLDSIETAVGVSPTLEIRSGAAPANCAAADSGTLLASIALPSDWMAAAASASKATVRQLMTHTAGLGYFFTNGSLLRYLELTGEPSPLSGEKRSLRTAAPQALRMIRGFNLIEQMGQSKAVIGLNMLRLWEATACESFDFQAFNVGDYLRAVLDDALVLTIDRAYFGLTGGLERWLYRLVQFAIRAAVADLEKRFALQGA